MKNVYDATDERKREIIELENIDMILRKRWTHVGIEDLVLVRTCNIFPMNGIVHPTDINEITQQKSSNWTLNGAILNGDDFIIVEPFIEQVNNPNLANINELDTWFNGDLKLSKKSIILISEEVYRILFNENAQFRDEVEKYNIALFRGDENLALQLLFNNKHFTYLNLSENGVIPDKYGDIAQYIKQLQDIERQVTLKLQQIGQNVTYGEKQVYYEDVEQAKKDVNSFNTWQQVEEEQLYIENINKRNSKMISGLTPEVEGDIELDEDCYASTGIGKIRENQEDAVLLVKDKEISDFKMLVVADGMGGEQKGELASHLIVNKLKDWFEGLSTEEKELYYSSVENLEEDLKNKIQEISFDVDWHLYRVWWSYFSMCCNWQERYINYKCRRFKGIYN
ncbi:MAG: hypothetical protein IKF17_01320 [Clostridia bacterium]|nr:hypothetical protein [Clostridia bacterium]